MENEWQIHFAFELKCKIRICGIRKSEFLYICSEKSWPSILLSMSSYDSLPITQGIPFLCRLHHNMSIYHTNMWTLEIGHFIPQNTQIWVTHVIISIWHVASFRSTTLCYCHLTLPVAIWPSLTHLASLWCELILTICTFYTRSSWHYTCLPWPTLWLVCLACWLCEFCVQKFHGWINYRAEFIG